MNYSVWYGFMPYNPGDIVAQRWYCRFTNSNQPGSVTQIEYLYPSPPRNNKGES